jgi:hypothetical protein
MKTVWILSWAIATLTLSSAVPGAPTAPLLQAHAHNDYLHARPLFDALDHDFCSVEADIHLVDGQLLVAHDRQAIKPGRTLQALYLDPLRDRVKKNGGRVFPGGPEFTLLIDLKSPWKTTYPALRDLLYQYADILTSYHSDVKTTNAITVILSGDRALEMFADEEERYAGYDGQLSELESGLPATLVPWISGSWGTSFKWQGAGEMPADEKEKLKRIVTRAHRDGRRVRFWGAPDGPGFWAQMVASQVDVINTDNLPGLQKFLQSRAK